MTYAIALWSREVTTGGVEFTPRADLHVKNVALGAELADEKGRTTLKLVYLGPPTGDDSEAEDEDEDGEEKAEPIATVLCSLTPGKIEHAKVDLILEGGETYVFDIVGKNTLYISGNYIEQAPSDLPPDEDELLSDEEDEEAFRLEDVSSDVEVPVDELDEDDEEEASEPLESPASQKKVTFSAPAKQESKKRPREEEPESEQPQLSKKQLKKLNKKFKAEGGNAVPAGQPAEAKEAKKGTNKPEQPQPAEQKKGGEGQGKPDGEGKKRKKRNRGDKAKL